MYDFFSNFCVSNGTYAHIYPSEEQARNKLNEIITNNLDDTKSVGVFKVCRYRPMDKQKISCIEKGKDYYKFFH